MYHNMRIQVLIDTLSGVSSEETFNATQEAKIEYEFTNYIYSLFLVLYRC